MLISKRRLKQWQIKQVVSIIEQNSKPGSLLKCFCGLVCLFSVLGALSVSSSVSAAVAGSESVRVYRGYLNTDDTWIHENIAVNNQDQMILYPLQNQSSGIFRFLFYPILTPQTSVKGIIIKDVDLSFYIEAPGGYTDVYVADHNLCTAPHIIAGGITGWTGTVSNCSYWFSSVDDYNYVHYHFDVVVSGNTSYSITSSDLAPIYISVGTNQYNVANDVPIYQRAVLVSRHPVYFNNITYGSIQYATSTTDSLLQEMISHQDATTGAIQDLEQTNKQGFSDLTDSIEDLNTSIGSVNDSIEDVNDTLTDDTVDTSNIDYSAIADSVPSFGPIATIVNNLIDFPRVFLIDDLCQPLNTPIPEYIGADDSTYLTIPCPSDFLEPYWSAVVLIESIASAYIYFKLAGFIVKQVEYMRDPERDDEEFLNL